MYTQNSNVLFVQDNTPSKISIGLPPIIVCQALTVDQLHQNCKGFYNLSNVALFFNTATPDENFCVNTLDATILGQSQKFAVINITHTLIHGEKNVLSNLSKEQINIGHLDARNYPLRVFFDIENAYSAKDTITDPQFNSHPYKTNGFHSNNTPAEKTIPVCCFRDMACDVGFLKPQIDEKYHKTPFYLFPDNYVLDYKNPRKKLGAKLFANAHDIIVQPTNNSEFEFVRVDDYYKAKQQPLPRG